ncbi:hypothetical protein JTE90_027417 [Oedothorax gibbosus]|uniref:Uncharacterized protein n=1 Tax=Oedothorax gibbosus TaxID=931172 RepID=A0AAV6W516_9ARAC|nr:hypothetical protein JTE90_027417 [Oedothorax gibbosus]
MSRISMYTLPVITFILMVVCKCTSEEVSSTSTDAAGNNRTGRVLDPVNSDRIVYKSDGYYKRNSPLSANNGEIPKFPRGFSDFVRGDQDYQATDGNDRGWSPYYLPPLPDSMYDGSSRNEVQVERTSNQQSDSPYPNYSPDYRDMMMMMQVMKKMDDGGDSKQGFLSKIIDNPTTLVMATFIPLSLLLAASLPLIVNVMMNGITIPAVFQTTTAGKAKRGNDEDPDLLRTLLESLADFSSRYLDGPDCFEKVFCEMSKQNSTHSNNVPGAKYLRQAANAATVIVNEDLLNSYGVKTFVEAVKNGKCEDIICQKTSNSTHSLINVINDAIYKYSFKSNHM